MQTFLQVLDGAANVLVCQGTARPLAVLLRLGQLVGRQVHGASWLRRWWGPRLDGLHGTRCSSGLFAACRCCIILVRWWYVWLKAARIAGLRIDRR